jgi:transcriptional regulator with XRE-family HTH domain
MPPATRRSRARAAPARKILAYNVVIYRAKKRLSQVELAKRSGVSRPTISRIEAGEGEPGIDVLERLADALGVKIADLFQDETSYPADDEIAAAAKWKKGAGVNAFDLLAALDEAEGNKPKRYSRAGRPRVER